MGFRKFPGPKKGSYIEEGAPCRSCGGKLKEWDCGCSWGCSTCWVDLACSKCDAKYLKGQPPRQPPGTPRRPLEACPICGKQKRNVQAHMKAKHVGESEKPGLDVTCHYCGEACIWSATSSHVYAGRDYGPIWECRPCDARCGCHKMGRPPFKMPLGTPADRIDRELRKTAHGLFDPLWQAVMRRDGIKKGHARARAYIWLAGELGIDPGDCHIGMMHREQLEAVISICTKPYGRKAG